MRLFISTLEIVVVYPNFLERPILVSLLKCVLFYLFVSTHFTSLFGFQWSFPLLNFSIKLVGSSGLEPPTSRLSGARSNHLSYEPIKLTSMYLVSLAFILRLLPLVEMMGFEPMTPCLQGRCSPNWATPPFWGSTVTENWTTKIKALCFHRAPFTHNFLPTYDTTHPWKCVRVSIERRWSSRTFRYGYLVTT